MTELRSRITVNVLPGFRREGFASCEALQNATGTSGPEQSIGLMELPRHLIGKWEVLKESMKNGEGMPSDQFAAWARAVTEFLRFKQVVLPAECRCNLLQIPAGAEALLCEAQPSTNTPEFQVIFQLGKERSSFAFALPQECSDDVGEEKTVRATVSDCVAIALEEGQGYLFQTHGKECDVRVTSPEATTLFMLAGTAAG